MVRPPVPENICLICKGARLLCGKKQCPILMKYSILKSTIPPEIQKAQKEKIVFGPSPPAVFVGHQGYPYVNIGPLIPLGDFAKMESTQILDSPESWFGKPLEEIISYRSGMIRTNFRIGVKYNENIDTLTDRLNRKKLKMLEATQELTIASNSVDTEAQFRRIYIKMQYDNHAQPQGPSGTAENIKVIDNVKVEKPVDKAVFDTDLKASEAILGYLYNADGVTLTQIQRILSSGQLGVKKNRKLVPTRWAITAVDDIIGKGLREELLHFPSVDKYLTFKAEYLDNKFLILIMPGKWSFEMNECWDPHSIWNRYVPGVNTLESLKPRIMTDWETEKGRKDYASNVTGAYYAARKEIEEFLYERHRQGKVIVFREVSGGYVVPLGVWVIRETVRNALQMGKKGRNIKAHDTLQSALKELDGYFSIPRKFWVKSSQLLKYLSTQKRLDAWMNFRPDS